MFDVGIWFLGFACIRDGFMTGGKIMIRICTVHYSVHGLKSSFLADNSSQTHNFKSTHP